VTLTAVPGIRVGHAEVSGGGSGCTVILGPFRGAVEVVGMATGSRELHVLSPMHLVERVNALLLTGGSAFGLGAADGVMAWLEARGEGFDTGLARVPLVPAGVIFDLVPGVGRPGPEEGQRACSVAGTHPVPEGRVGAGAGATVGKLRGMGAASPGGLGSASRRVDTGRMGEGVVGAMAVVNALGAVWGEDGRVLAGEGGTWAGDSGVASRWPEAASGESGRQSGAKDGWDGSKGRERGPKGGVAVGANTTLAVVATDLPLGRVDLGKLARMAAAALPRAIAPVATPFDGDLVFGVSTSEDRAEVPPEEILMVGLVARELLEASIRRAVSEDVRLGGGGSNGAS
jgi:L-aminopeptidase/D-esterase-like protein